LVLLSASRANAQARGDAPVVRLGYVHLFNSERPSGGTRGRRLLLWPAQRAAMEPVTLGTNIRRLPISTLDYSGAVISHRTQVPAFQASSAGRQRSGGRKVLGGVLGAVGGFFAGGFLGAAIEGGRCGCDDPGLAGFLIGAPVGAVTLGIVGAKFF
jgi:hypothetical protein